MHPDTEGVSSSFYAIPGMKAFGSGSVANAAVAPDGSSSADFVCEDTSTGAHRVFYNNGYSVISGDTYAQSVFVKAGGRTSVWLANNSLVGAFFDLTTGAVSSVTAASAGSESYGGGWWRLWITAPAGSTTERLLVCGVVGGSTSYAGDGASGFYPWGFQLSLIHI